MLTLKNEYQMAVNEYLMADGERVALLNVFSAIITQRAEAGYVRFIKASADLRKKATAYAGQQWPNNRQNGLEFLMADVQKQIVINQFTKGAASKEQVNEAFLKWAQAKESV